MTLFYEIRVRMEDIVTEHSTLNFNFSENIDSTLASDIVQIDHRMDNLIQSLLIICLSTIALAGVFGNSLVVIAVCKIRTLNSVTDYFICSLACADLFVSAAIMPFAIVTEVSQGKWLFGPAFCAIWSSLDILCCTSSVWNLCAISLDRYLAIQKPLVYRDIVTPRMCCLGILTVWVLSTILASSQLLWKYSLGVKDPPYTCLYAPDPGFRVYATLTGLFIPMLVIVFVYSRIIPVAFKHAREISNMEVRVTHQQSKSIRMDDMSGKDLSLDHQSKRQNSLQQRETVCDEKPSAFAETSVTTNAPKLNSGAASSNPTQAATTKMPTVSETSTIQAQKSQEHQQGGLKPAGIIKKSRNKELKVMRTLVMVIGVFFVCWMPFAITHVIEPFLNKSVSIPMISVFLWLGYVNSVSNPVIYVWLNKSYRRACKKVLCGSRDL